MSTEAPRTIDSPIDVFVYHLLRGQPKELGDGREWSTFRLFGWTADYERVCMVVRDTPTIAYLELRPRNEVVWTRPGGWMDWLPSMRHELAKLKPILLSDMFTQTNMGRYSKFGFRWRGIEPVELVLSTPGRYDLSQSSSIPIIPPLATPLLRLEFETSFALRDFEQHVRMDMSMRYSDHFDVYIHESDSFLDVPIRCLARHDLPQSGWMHVKEYTRYRPEDRKEREPRGRGQLPSATRRHHWCRAESIEWDLDVQWDALTPLDHDPPPLLPRRLMVFDIETYSSRSVSKQAYPEYKLVEDCVFQVSVVIWSGERPQDPPKSYLLSLKRPDPKIVGADCTTRWCADERDLLRQFIELVDECDVFTGWNILGYDWEYVYHRCVRQGLTEALLGVGCVEGLQGRWVEKVSDSKAHATQNYRYFEAEGKLHVDMLPLIRRDYKLNNYKLDTVLKRFKMPLLKVDLKAQEMFRLYREGTPEGMGRVGYYCMVDSLSCLGLWQRLNVWIGLLEMSKLTGVSLVTLCTKGTQIQMATRVVRVLWSEGRVLGQLKDFDPENPSGRRRVEEVGSHSRRKEKKFTGATVFTVVPGLYRWVVVLDFASLYPSIIRGRNLDYRTLVHDEWHPSGVDPTVPDELCNVIQFSDHVGCEHDQSRKRLKNGEFSRSSARAVVCAEHRFRWLREEVVGEGLLPKILSGYLDARKATRRRMGMVRRERMMPLLAQLLVRGVEWRVGMVAPSVDELARAQAAHPIFEEVMRTGEKDVTLSVVDLPWAEVVALGAVHDGSLEASLVEAVRTVLVELVVMDKRQLSQKIASNCFPSDHQIFTRRGFMDLDAVLEHFRHHASLAVACSVDGRLEYRDVGLSGVVMDVGVHRMVTFDDGRGLSVTATENHRMWVARGGGGLGGGFGWWWVWCGDCG